MGGEKSEDEPLVHLWRVDDEDWMHRRIYAWWRMRAREGAESREPLVKSYWDAAERFFLRGRPRKSDKKIYRDRRMAYTPFESVEQVIEVYRREHVSLRGKLHGDLLRLASHAYRAVPDEFDRVELLCEALYTPDFAARTEVMGPRAKPEFVVAHPRDATSSYLVAAANHLERSKIAHLNRIHDMNHHVYDGRERSHVEVTLDYFLACFDHALAHDMIDERQIKGVKKLCPLVEIYAPEVDNPHRDRFVAEAQTKLLTHPSIQQVRAMNL